MTDLEFTLLLRSALRELSEEEVAKIESTKDATRGAYVPHEHRAYYGEAGH